jgi:hypothetical protein
MLSWDHITNNAWNTARQSQQQSYGKTASPLQGEGWRDNESDDDNDKPRHVSERSDLTEEEDGLNRFAVGDCIEESSPISPVLRPATPSPPPSLSPSQSVPPACDFMGSWSLYILQRSRSSIWSTRGVMWSLRNKESTSVGSHIGICSPHSMYKSTRSNIQKGLPRQEQPCTTCTMGERSGLWSLHQITEVPTLQQ